MLQYFLLCLASPSPGEGQITTTTSRPANAHYEVMDRNSPLQPVLRIITPGMSIEASNWSWLVLIWQPTSSIFYRLKF